MRNLSLLALAAALVPGLALAQDGTVSIGYGQLDPEGGSNLDVFSFAGTVDYDIDAVPGLTFGATGRYSDVDDLGDATNIFGDLSYEVSNGISLGVFGQLFDVDGVPALNTYGLLLGYELGPLAASVYYGITDADGLGDSLDEYGIAASYDTGEYALYGSYQNTDDDLEVFGVAGSYTFADAFSVFGAYATIDDDNLNSLGDTDAYGVGASYSIDGLVAGNPLVISVDYTNLDFDALGTEFDQFGLVLTVPFGGASGVIPEQSLAGSVANPGYSALVSSVDTLF